ncbi:MAG: hypothetical protein J5J06_06130, partial [Phycisphaerae bacterium]|nr:hypothetical protein [Phycisphaerae bacterium]
MKALIQTGSSLSACGHAQAGGRVPVPHEKRFLINYSCGGLIHNGRLILPYAMSDQCTSFTTFELDRLLKDLRRNGS